MNTLYIFYFWKVGWKHATYPIPKPSRCGYKNWHMQRRTGQYFIFSLIFCQFLTAIYFLFQIDAVWFITSGCIELFFFDVRNAYVKVTIFWDICNFIWYSRIFYNNYYQIGHEFRIWINLRVTSTVNSLLHILYMISPCMHKWKHTKFWIFFLSWQKIVLFQSLHVFCNTNFNISFWNLNPNKINIVRIFFVTLL